MRPAATACVPWYRPQSSAPKVAVMMNPTSTERTRVRLIATSNAASVAASNRRASRVSWP